MSDKSLTELEWKRFSKGRGLKDAALAKALAALEAGRTPEDKLGALTEIGKQADALRRAHKADKDVVGYLDDVEKAANREHKLQEAEARKLARKEDAGDGDEEDSPALLTSKMVPLLREVKKGESVLQALIAVRNTP